MLSLQNTKEKGNQMKMVLNNGLKVLAAHTHSGRLKHVAASLDSLGLEGFAVVDFFKNGHARETCVCPSEGFVSMKTYNNNRLTTEMFRDILHQKTFYYIYNELGYITETWLDSCNKEWQGNLVLPRDVMTHSPIKLFEELQTAPQMLVKGHNLAVNLEYIRSERSRAA